MQVEKQAINYENNVAFLCLEVLKQMVSLIQRWTFFA